MTEINLKALISRLNETCRRTLEAAAGLTLSRTHYNVEIEHWLLKLMESDDNDISLILRHFEVDRSRLSTDLTRMLDRLKTGNARAPSLSPNIVELAKSAWLIGSIDHQASLARSGHLLLALLGDDHLSRLAQSMSDQLIRIDQKQLKAQLHDIVGASSEASSVEAGPSGHDGTAAVASPGNSKTPALDRFTIDLTARARSGAIDPVLGRDHEIRQVIDILTRRRQNNPILTGEAGVGKTAVVEGFALRIAAGDVPAPLASLSLRVLDLGLLQAGAGVKGEFENRLKDVINDVKFSAEPIILFVDEAHTLIGAGGQAGQGDAANLLKPELARGELRVIAATTWAEYKKYFESDAALARRFQVVKVEEPSEAVATEMMRGIANTLEEHHQVRILDEAVTASVRLSHRYIVGRQLPDKSVSLLDTASARVALSQNTTPPAVEDGRREVRRLGTEIGIVERENVISAHHIERLADLRSAAAEAEVTCSSLEARWQQEQVLVQQIREAEDRLRGAVEAGDGATAGHVAGDGAQEALRLELNRLNDELGNVRSDSPLVHISVDEQAIAEVVGNWTGIPVGRMVTDEIDMVLDLQAHLEKRVIGQPHAMAAVAESICISRAKLTDPDKPIGVFLMAGTSGVGKTETALTLAELLYSGRQSLTMINMSEFKEEHKVATLMGAPPGYVGYGEGGVLTEAVRRRPYGVILLDEMEKAHPGVQDVFYQVFDRGMLRDSQGRDVDFKNTVIIMTSNVGTDTIADLCADPAAIPDAEELAEALRPELLRVFKPAFLGRLTVLPYFPLSDDVMRRIIELKLDSVRRRIEENYNGSFSYAPELIDVIAARCTETQSGARNIDSILNHALLPHMSSEFLACMAENRPVSSVHIEIDDEGNFLCRVG